MGRRALRSSSMDRWAGHGLMVARDSAVKLLAVIYDVYYVSSPLWSGVLLAREAPVGYRYKGSTSQWGGYPPLGQRLSRVLRAGGLAGWPRRRRTTGPSRRLVQVDWPFTVPLHAAD